MYGFQNGHRLWEDFCEHNEELGGDDGFADDVEPTSDQISDLKKSFADMFQSWLDRHGMKPHVFQFGTRRNEEYFPVPDTKETTE